MEENISPQMLQIELNAEELASLQKLCAREEKSLDTGARDLLVSAIEEMMEDLYFSRLAEESEANNTGWVSHDDAWK